MSDDELSMDRLRHHAKHSDIGLFQFAVTTIDEQRATIERLTAALREIREDMIDSQQYRELRKGFFAANASDETERKV